MVDARLKFALQAWPAAEARVMPLRIAVFVIEQGVPEELERDAFDPLSLHIVCETTDGAVIGTGRLLPDGHIGRLAVVPSWRGQGVGGRLLATLVAEAVRLGMDEVVLHAQAHAEGFYLRHGFVPEGPLFDEAGIDHRRMRRVLKRV